MSYVRRQNESLFLWLSVSFPGLWRPSKVELKIFHQGQQILYWNKLIPMENSRVASLEMYLFTIDSQIDLKLETIHRKQIYVC